MGEYKILRDIHGSIRIDTSAKFTTEQVKDIIETIFVKTGHDMSIKQLDMSLIEYDGPHSKRKGGTNRLWSDSDEEYVLLHYKEDNGTIGKGINRTFMSIKHAKSDLLTGFYEWIESHPELVKGLTHEQCVKLYMKGG
jgi:hypothetical protein